jgi:hypothetical protein
MGGQQHGDRPVCTARKKGHDMRTITKGQKAIWAGLLVYGMLGALAPVQASESDEYDGGRLQIDNDLFAGQEHDRDYTGGMTLTLSGERAREGQLSLDPLLSRLDGLVLPLTDGTRLYAARQVGFMAFTPTDIHAATPIHDERPYASLLFVSNARMRVDADDRAVWFTSFTVGALGLSAAGDLQNAVHQVVGSPKARGYRYQISAGGEPTARYIVARQTLWIANPSGTVDVKTTVQGSVGYLTEASAAVSARFGRFGTAWWSTAPELTDYTAAAVPTLRESTRSDFYVFAGARLTARAYNALLQGQFRHSEVRLSADEVEPLIVQGWIGIVTEVMQKTQVSYTLNYQSAEVRAGEAARDALWGAVQISHGF